jgi:Domain of unknown function (DUF1772)
MWKGIVLWLFIINLGVAFGAGLYEARVVIPQWENTPPRAWPNTGLMFWVYVTTVPLTVLTIANLIAAWLTQGPMRFWYLAAVCIVIVERVATFSYFIPTMVRLMSTEGLADGDIKAALSQWLLMNHGRHVLTLAGWLAALKAFSLSGRPYGNG